MAIILNPRDGVILNWAIAVQSQDCTDLRGSVGWVRHQLSQPHAVFLSGIEPKVAFDLFGYLKQLIWYVKQGCGASFDRCN